MGRIVASVRIENLSDKEAKIRCDALVDTGASYMVLPSAWRDRLGELDEIAMIPLATATQSNVEGFFVVLFEFKSRDFGLYTTRYSLLR